jgi:esterase/lipase
MAQKTKDKLMKLESKYLKLNDIEIAYTEYGEGQNLILIHGNSESKNIFMNLQVNTYKNYHTYALDSRGHGESISIENELSIDKISNDVIAFCEKMRINESYVIGYSDGGNVALFLGLKDPQRFKKIISISPNYLMSGTKESVLKLFIALNNLFIQLRSIGIDTSKYIKRFRLLLSDINISKEQLKTIKTSVCILYAENDLIKENHILEIASLIPNSICKKVMKCNHLNIYKKEECISDVKDFFVR